MPRLEQEGEFIGEVVRQEFKVIGERKTPAFELMLEVTVGPEAGKHAWATLWLTPAAVSYSVKTVKEFFPDWNGDIEDLIFLDRTTCVMMVKQRCRFTMEKDARGRYKVKFLHAPKRQKVDPEILSNEALQGIADALRETAAQAALDFDAMLKQGDGGKEEEDGDLPF